MGEQRAAQPAAAHAEVEALSAVGEAAEQDVREVVLSRIRDIPDFPQPGVLFKDFTPLLADGGALATVVDDVADRYADRVDVVVGIEARGFVIGAAVAYRLGLGFVPVRKAGKLPGPSLSEEYTLEYGSAVLEIHRDALRPGQRAVVVDDVLATGGTAEATCRLVERAGAAVVGVDVVLELAFLEGRARVSDRALHAIVTL